MNALRLHARHRFDIRARDLAHGLTAAWLADRDVEVAVETLWSPRGGALACSSVRSGLHLLLRALELPAGSEVLVSAVTHPDMVRIVEHHGLVPVPVDLDVAALAPRPDRLAAALTPRTRVLLVAHLFGSRIDLGPAAELAARCGLLLIEDCAQAFGGPGDTGDARADVSMYSFGALKTATALGGALLQVRDAALLGRMRRIQAGWPRQRRREHLARLCKFAVLAGLTRPLAYGLLARGWRALGCDFDRMVGAAVRAFPAGGTPELIARLERRPCRPLLALLAHRLRTFDRRRLRARAAAGDRLARGLPAGLRHPGRAAPEHTHWLFPVVAPCPGELIARLRAAGFDAARGASSVAAVVAPDGRPDAEPCEATRMMADLVFLPAYPELGARRLDRLSELLRDRRPIPQ